MVRPVNKGGIYTGLVAARPCPLIPVSTRDFRHGPSDEAVCVYSSSRVRLSRIQASKEDGPVPKSPKPVGQAGLCPRAWMKFDAALAPACLGGRNPPQISNTRPNDSPIFYAQQSPTPYVCFRRRRTTGRQIQPGRFPPNRRAAWLCFRIHRQGTTHRYLDEARNQQNLGRYARWLRKRSGVAGRLGQLDLLYPPACIRNLTPAQGSPDWSAYPVLSEPQGRCNDPHHAQLNPSTGSS